MSVDCTKSDRLELLLFTLLMSSAAERILFTNIATYNKSIVSPENVSIKTVRFLLSRRLLVTEIRATVRFAASRQYICALISTARL